MSRGPSSSATAVRFCRRALFRRRLCSKSRSRSHSKLNSSSSFTPKTECNSKIDLGRPGSTAPNTTSPDMVVPFLNKVPLGQLTTESSFTVKYLPVINCPIEVNPTAFLVLKVLQVAPPHRFVQEESIADRPSDHNGDGRPHRRHDHHNCRHRGGSRLR